MDLALMQEVYVGGHYYLPRSNGHGGRWHLAGKYGDASAARLFGPYHARTLCGRYPAAGWVEGSAAFMVAPQNGPDRPGACLVCVSRAKRWAR